MFSYGCHSENRHRPGPGRPWAEGRIESTPDLVFRIVPLKELSAFHFPILGSDLDGFTGVQFFHEKGFEFLLGSVFLVLPQQLTDVFAGSAVASFLDSFFHEVLEPLRRDMLSEVMFMPVK